MIEVVDHQKGYKTDWLITRQADVGKIDPCQVDHRMD